MCLYIWYLDLRIHFSIKTFISQSVPVHTEPIMTLNVSKMLPVFINAWRQSVVRLIVAPVTLPLVLIFFILIPPDVYLLNYPLSSVCPIGMFTLGEQALCFLVIAASPVPRTMPLSQSVCLLNKEAPQSCPWSNVTILFFIIGLSCPRHFCQ